MGCGHYSNFNWVRGLYMKKTILISVIALIVWCSATSEASWIFYHKPQFNGRVVDIDTKQPIEGAVVVAIYEKQTLNPPAGSYTNIIHVKEALTDKDGRFHFPSYMTLIHPLSYSGNCVFVIYKPGYGNLGQIGIEYFVSNRAEKPLERNAYWNPDLKFRYLPDGTIEIPLLTNNEDMKDALSNARIWGASLDIKYVPILADIEVRQRKILYNNIQ